MRSRGCIAGNKSNQEHGIYVLTVNPDLHRRATTLGLLATLASRPAYADDGTIERLPDLAAPGIAPRAVEVWLPPGFDRTRRYAALYMHDGQMLFDPARSWNRKSWDLDRVATQLLAANQLRDFIVVAIANDPQRRHAEYFPQAALAFLQPEKLRETFAREAFGGVPAGDAYARFLVEVVKPTVDARYPTLGTPEHTCIMGSSMGGLASLYAVCEYPQVFGAAAALSTHWIGSFERNRAIPAALLEYLRRKLPPADRIRLYMDRGTEGLDALYDVAQADVDRLMAEQGHIAPTFFSKVFNGADHDEDAWSARLAEPLRFLLGHTDAR